MGSSGNAEYMGIPYVNRPEPAARRQAHVPGKQAPPARTAQQSPQGPVKAASKVETPAPRVPRRKVETPAPRVPRRKVPDQCPIHPRPPRPVPQEYKNLTKREIDLWNRMEKDRYTWERRQQEDWFARRMNRQNQQDMRDEYCSDRAVNRRNKDKADARRLTGSWAYNSKAWHC